MFNGLQLGTSQRGDRVMKRSFTRCLCLPFMRRGWRFRWAEAELAEEPRRLFICLRPLVSSVSCGHYHLSASDGILGSADTTDGSSLCLGIAPFSPIRAQGALRLISPLWAYERETGRNQPHPRAKISHIPPFSHPYPPVDRGLIYPIYGERTLHKHLLQRQTGNPS